MRSRNRVVLFKCQYCKTSILYEHVYNVARIGGVSSHVAVLFQCPNCNQQGRAAAAWQEWQDLEQESFDLSRSNEVLINMAHLDLEAVNDIGDLEIYWRAIKPPIEGQAQRCGCSQCIKEDDE